MLLLGVEVRLGLIIGKFGDCGQDGEVFEFDLPNMINNINHNMRADHIQILQIQISFEAGRDWQLAPDGATCTVQ
jgi:hypothetical protein